MAYTEKITVIGFKNAGKTTYLAGMYDLLSNGLKRFYLHTSPDDDQYLSLLWENISDGEARKWPVPTDEKRPYTFRLSHDLKDGLPFEWLDYPGGALTDPNMGMYDELVEQLKKSSCVLLLVNGESFMVDAANEKEYRKAVHQALKKNKDLLAAKKLGDITLDHTNGNEKAALPPVAIVLTKSDLIPEKWNPLVKSILEEEFAAVFGKSDSQERLVVMMDVTLGEDIENGVDADPINIEQPIAFAALSILKRKSERIKAAQEKYQGIINKERGFFASIFDRDEIQYARENLAKEKKEASELAGKINPLLDLFEDDKNVYVNGCPESLHRYFTKVINDV